MRTGDYGQAIDDFGKAIEFDPTSAASYAHRGNAYSQKGYFEEAIADYSEAIRRSPALASAVVGRGNAYLVRGEYDLAIKDFDRAEELGAATDQVRHNRQQALAEKAKRDAATGIAIERNVTN